MKPKRVQLDVIVLVLLFRYGYRGNDCRKNIHILVSGEVLYFISYVVVIYNQETHRQRHYKEHTEDIKWYSWRIYINNIC